MGYTQLLLAGDSLTRQTLGTYTQAQGAQGDWSDFVTERIANIAGVGPVLTSGIHGMWLASDWAYTGAWTSVLSTDAWDKMPYNGISTQPGKYANGSGFTARWTKPAGIRTMVGYNFYFVDYTNGGNFQLSEDGGAYFNIDTVLSGGGVRASDNKIIKVYIARPITATLDVKAYNGAAGAGCFPLGVEAVYSTATTGLITHNIAITGSKLHELCATTSGDRLAFLDAVKLGNASTVAVGPFAASVVGHINDVTLASSSGYGTDLTTFYNRASPLGPVGIWSPWECLLATYDQTQQTNYRSQAATSATSLGAQYMSIYTQWSNTGWTGNAAATAAGFLADGTHENQAGHIDLAPRFYWWIRTKLLGLGNVPSTYAASAKQAAVQYSGKQAAVQYSAAAPIGVG